MLDRELMLAERGVRLAEAPPDDYSRRSTCRIAGTRNLERGLERLQRAKRLAGRLKTRGGVEELLERRGLRNGDVAARRLGIGGKRRCRQADGRHNQRERRNCDFCSRPPYHGQDRAW